MSEYIGPSEIHNLQSDQKEEASIFKGLSDKDLDDIETHWKPMLVEKENLIRSKNSDSEGKIIDVDGYSDQISHYRIQDWKWDWRHINNTVLKDDTFRIFSLTCDGVLQGIICVNTDYYQCRLNSQKGMAVVYVDRFAIAPWNRKPWFNPRKYQLIGESLFATVVSLSIEIGLDGRICLHSLPQAYTWYERIGMTNHGPDSAYKNMNWYEMTSEDSRSFLGN